MRAKAFVSNLIREPLFHFALIGAAIFLMFPGDSGPAPVEDMGNVIEVTPQIRDGLAAQFVSTWNRQPTPDEIAGLMAEYVKEEVLYREAVALGLDQGDPVIRQRLRLKMEFIGEGATAALVPTEAELAAWYAANASDYTPPATVSFDQVMLADPAEAEATLSALQEGADPATLGRGSLLPARIERATANVVDGTFGRDFYSDVAGLEQGVWSGPVESAYGAHVVRLFDVTVAEALPLEQVRDAVAEGWRREQADLTREAQFQAFLSRYEVRLPEDGAS